MIGIFGNIILDLVITLIGTSLRLITRVIIGIFRTEDHIELRGYLLEALTGSLIEK